MTVALAPSDCPMCGGSGDRRFWFNPAGSAESHGLDACRSCGVRFVNPRPGAEAMAEYFSDPGLYQGSTDPDGRQRNLVAERDRRRSEYEVHAGRLRSWVPAGRVLDAGCGLGLFLELLGDGYDRIGVDVNPLAVDFTRDRVDVEVRRMDLMDVWFEPGALDAAVVMQTLDHLHRPGDFLDRSAGWLRPGGVLFLSSLININSLCGRWFGPDFRLLHPFHAVYFTPATLRRHLAERGLKVIRLEYPYFNTPYFHWRDAVDLAVRGAGRLVGRRGRPSPPFWGNTINAWAVKEA